MTAPSIQFAPSVNAANTLAPSAHAFETSAETGASFAEHLNQAVQSSARPVSRPETETQPSQSARTDSQAAAPRQASVATPQAQRPAIAVRPSTPQTKQNPSNSGKANTAAQSNTGGKAQNADPSPVQKDNQRQQGSAGNADSRSSDSSRNTDGRQASEEQTTANSKSPFAQAIAQSAAEQADATTQSGQAASGEAQSNGTGAQPSNASIPASLPAWLQGSQSPTQAVTIQPEGASGNVQNPVETDSSTSVAAYQASLTSFQSPVQAVAQSISTADANSVSQTSAGGSNANSLPSLDQQPSASGAGTTPSARSSSDSPSSAGQAVSGNDPSALPSVPSPQANQNVVAQAATASANGQNVDSSPADSAPATPVFANSLPSLDQQPSASSADATPSASSSSDSSGVGVQTSSGNDPSSPASPLGEPTDATNSSASASPVASLSPTEHGQDARTTPATASEGQVDASAAPSLPVTNQQPTLQAKSATVGRSPQVGAIDSGAVIGDLKFAAAQQEAARSALEQALNSARAKTEPVAAVLQQVAGNATVVTSHEGSSTPTIQPSAVDSQPSATGPDSGSLAGPASQGSTSALTDGFAGDSLDDSSAPASSSSQGSNSSKASDSPVATLPSSAFNSDGVAGVASAAVHAAASATLQSNTGFDNASPKAPATVSQSFNSAAQEKAFAAWQSVSEQVGRVVNTATLNALQNGTEMRVQLRTDAFGSMDIRATLEGGKVGAAIGVESAEAHNALLGQLPALQQSLNERQVQLDQISVVSSHEQSGTNFGSGKQNGDPTTSGGYRQQQPGEPELVSEPASALVTETWQPETSPGRLSVRA